MDQTDSVPRTEPAGEDLFPAALRSPASAWWLSILPAALLTLLNSFCFWLVWGEMKEPSQRVYAAVLIASSILPGLAGLAAVCLSACRKQGLSAWAQVALGVCALAHLTCFCVFSDNALPPDTPDWVVGPSFFLAQFACAMPGLFAALWRVAGVRLNVSPWTDLGVSLLFAFLPPSLLYGAVAVVNLLGTAVSWRGSAFLFRSFLAALLMVGPMLFFLGLLRCLMIVRRFFAQRGKRSRAFQMGYIGCVSLVLPIAGLLLNKQIPFPADFQNPWPYAFTVLTALALMMPETGGRWADGAARAARLVLFPFTCYFFVVFLPFLPFAIMAILALGAGFLVLAPTLLFMVHGQILKRDHEQALAAGTSRLALWGQTLLCVLALPLGFALRAEADRSALHETLGFRLVRLNGADAELSVSPEQVRRVLLNVRRFKDGAELPYLANWYNWRVFDNLLLQDEKVDELWRLIVGGEPPKPGKEDFARNAFASLFGGRTRSPERRFGGAQRPVPRNVVLSDVQSTCATDHGEVETRVTLKVTSRDAAGQAEYAVKLKVPPGVWVSGLRLKIGDTWEEGRVIERKAAEWVYRQIRDVSRRDPAILRYEDESTLTLRVFPVEPGATREVEVSFLCPEGLADAVMIGERRVTLGDGTMKPLCAWADGVFVRNGAWQPPGEACVTPQPVGHLVLDCSAGSEWGAERVAATLNQARAALGLPLQKVTLANYERRSVTASVQEIQGNMLPPRGSFDAATVLRELAFDSRRRSFGDVGPHAVWSPRIVLAGRSVRAALDQVKPDEWRAVRDEWPLVTELLVMDERGGVTPFAVPQATEDVGTAAVLSSAAEARLCLGSRADQTVFIKGDAELQLRLLAREGERCAPVPGMTVMPPESRWAKGAAAWRLQRDWELYPAPVRNPVRRAALAASRESGVLTTGGAFIVVENSMQWKMLEVKQRQVLAGDAAFDLVESPAPGAWLLVALAAAAVWVANRFRGLNVKRNG